MKLKVFVLYSILIAVGVIQTSIARPATHSVSASPLETCEVLEAYFAHYEEKRREKFAKLPALKGKVQTFRYVEPQTAWFKPREWNRKSNPNYSPQPRPADAETTRAAVVAHHKYIGTRIGHHNKYFANFNEARSDDKKTKLIDPIYDDTFGAYSRAQSHTIDLSKCDFGTNIHTDTASLKVLGELMKARAKYDQKDRDAYKQARKTSKAHRRKTGESLNVREIKENLTMHLVQPQGYMVTKLSAVGINFEHGQAMFYTEHYCGFFCAGGNYVFMKREHGKWVYSGAVRTWIS